MFKHHGLGSWKWSGCGQENREYCCGDPPRWPLDALPIPKSRYSLSAD
jgi:hypothetical protein